jgi:transposase
MLTREDDININALHQQGWTISAIARHTGRDRKTVRAYLTGVRSPGVRERPGGDPFDRFVDYVTARLAEDRSRCWRVRGSCREPAVLPRT